MLNHPLLCPTCDTSVRQRAIPRGRTAYCPRCKSRIYDAPYCDTDGLTALTLTALLIFFPANLLPILEFNLLGSIRETTVINAAIMLIDEGFFLVGITVIIAGVIAPLLLLSSILLQLTLMKYERGKEVVRWLLLHHPTLDKLSMVEIYTISLFVSIFKLSDIADVAYGWGTLSFVMLFISIFYVQYEYNSDLMWQYFDDTY